MIAIASRPGGFFLYLDPPINSVSEALLISIFPTVDGHAVQLYTGRESLSLSHRLQKKARPSTYPKGLEINLTVFAGEHKGLNFDCGLNHFCSAGQLCSPISGREWWILAATEQANLYLNSVYTAIGLPPASQRYVQDAQRKARLFQSIAMMLTAVLAVVWYDRRRSEYEFYASPRLETCSNDRNDEGFLDCSWPGRFWGHGHSGCSSCPRAGHNGDEGHAAEVEAGKQDTFTKKWQSKTQEEIGNRAKELVEYPISSHKGLYGILEGGDYCRNSQKKDTNDLEKNLSRVLTIRLVGQILRTKKGFVTIGNGCVQNGPNGAFRIEDGWLSYCDKWDGTMMNVIWDDDGPDFDPYADGTNMPTDENGLCLINLPVCDTNDGGVRKKLKHHSTVKACRTAGGVSLPS
ncbi:hypothetical protein H4Q26_011713 [Puccinia striiformis f. sp. tritici PST-130]|nr:hypothetical protein H4Q26_011713 [Puccinia striiformis f. sp. tritici PST-130]